MRQMLVTKHNRLIELMRQTKMEEMFLTNYSAFLEELAGTADFDEFLSLASQIQDLVDQQLDV
jgi:hypothetical protein